MIYAWQNLSDPQKDPEEKLCENGTVCRQNNGFLGTIEYTQGNLFGGFNRVVFQYGHDAFDKVGVLSTGNHAGDTVVPYPEKGNGYRLIDYGVIEQPSWNLGYSFMMAHRSSFGENTQNAGEGKKGGDGWGHPSGNDYSVVLRPSYKWSDFTSTVLELGYTNQVNWGWTGLWWQAPNRGYSDVKRHAKATKVTIAQQWTPGSHFWARPSIRVFASWLSGDLINHRATGIAEDNHQITLGAQVEAWW